MKTGNGNQQRQETRLRGLKLLLGMVILQWQSLHAALHIAKHELPDWKNFLMKRQNHPANALPNDPEALQLLVNEVQKKTVALLQGVDRYLGVSYTPQHQPRPTIWHSGSARLLDCGNPEDIAQNKPPILLIPSLINRYYILDLTPQTSFVEFLHSQGFHPFILDWGEPGAAENGFRCEDYVSRYIGTALQELYAINGKPVTLVGYCMGGLLAVAAAQKFSQYVAKLALIATPWDFHAPDSVFFHRHMSDSEIDMLHHYVAMQNGLGADEIQILFHLMNPQAFIDKFGQYSQMQKDSPEAERFVAVEYWANDGVRLVPGVALECYIDWLQNNSPHNGKWCVTGDNIKPENIKQPTFITIPANDRIVPRQSAMALADAIAGSTVIHPESGHIGMLVGKKRKQQMWQPFADWMRSAQ